MTLAPFQNLFWPRLRRASRQRVYARDILASWEASVQGQLFKQLEMLPLPLIKQSSGQQRTLAQALAHDTRIAVYGPEGSGRTLRLQQVMVQWARDSIQLPTTLPIYIQLHSADTPDVVVRQAIHQAGFDANPLIVERGLAAGHWLLLLDGLEQLAADAAQQWLEWLYQLAERYPALAVVVVIASEEALPQSFSLYSCASATEDTLHQWIDHLLPQEESTLLLGPLVHDQRLRLLGTQLCDVVLLCFMYPTQGFPSNRVRLYTSVLDRVLRLYKYDVVRLRRILAEFGYATLTHKPYTISKELQSLLERLRGLVVETSPGNYRFTQPVFQKLCAALYVASHPEAVEDLLNSAAWPDVLPLAAGLVTNPEFIYQAVGELSATPQHQLVLGACLREHHVSVLPWSAQIMKRLLDIAPTYPAAWTILDDLHDVVQATIAEQLTQGETGEHWVLAFVRGLPIERSLPFLLDILVDSRLLRSTRRVAALHLIQHGHEYSSDNLVALLRRSLDPLGTLLSLRIISEQGTQGRALLATHISQADFIFPAPQTAMDAHLLVGIATTVLSYKEAGHQAHMRAAAALRGCASEATAPLLLQACTSPSPLVRQTARQTLLTAQPSLALRSLGRLLLGDDIHWAAQSEALETLIKLSGSSVAPLLVRIIQGPMPLSGRIIAAQELLKRPDGLAHFDRLLQTQTLSASLTAALLSMLASHPHSGPLILQHMHTEPLGSLHAIKSLGQQRSDEALAMLAGIVEHERTQLATLVAAIEALGRQAAEAGIWALRSVLLGELKEQLRKPWERALDRLTLEDPPATWPLDRLPDALQWRLGIMLAFGHTRADTPGNLDEFLAHEITLLRSAAARALGQIGGPTARDVLREALLVASSADGYGPAPAVAAELAQLEVNLGGDTLASSLRSHTPPLIRWVSAYALQQTPEAGQAIRQGWAQIDIDAETRSLMLTALGSDPRIVPLLETLIVDDQAPQHLRLDAIRALGQAEVAHAEGLLMAIIASSQENPHLATEALNVLKAPLAQATLQAIRSLLRTPRPQLDVIAAALNCLVRAADQQSLALFMRFAQHESPAVAVPAIDGLVMCADSTVIALLNRLAHTSNKATRIRLQAISGLLALEGAQHLPAIQQMIEKGSIATRLLALESLLRHAIEPNELIEQLNGAWPLPLRLHLAQTLAHTPNEVALEAFKQLLVDPYEQLSLRLIALQAVCEAEYHGALAQIEELAQSETTPLALKHKALSCLKHWRHEPTTALLLSHLAEQSPAVFIRAWALEALLD